ncbi:MAG: alanine racemase [Ruminococcus sp.]|nr:alanine racemase [Ruminococcus sp.]
MLDSYVQIDLTKLKNNASAIIKKYPEYKNYIAVVKGDAYGHGMSAVKALYDGGINYFAVSSLEEARALREICSDVPVLYLEPVSVDRLEEAKELDLTLGICDMTHLKSVLGAKTEHSFNLHLQVDAGFNRLGFNDKEEISLAQKMIKESQHQLQGIYQHFATAGIFDPHYDNQIRRFKELTSLIDLSEIPMVHLGSGVALLAHPKIDVANTTRMGLLVYGYNVGPQSYGGGIKNKIREMRDKYYQKKYNLTQTIKDVEIELSPAMEYKCRILQLKRVKAGEFVGYNASYKAESDITLAVLPVGYNNGIGHANFSRCVQIGEKLYPVVGEIGMNMCAVKVDESVKITDEVTLLGKKITLGMFCRGANLGLAEALVSIGKNNERIYI